MTDTPTEVKPRRMLLREQVAALLAENRALKRQRDIVGTMLRDEAYEREWCSDYNHFVNMVNRACEDQWLLPLACDEEG